MFLSLVNDNILNKNNNYFFFEENVNNYLGYFKSVGHVNQG